MDIRSVDRLPKFSTEELNAVFLFIFVYAMDGAKRLTMANAKETVKRKGWYLIPLLCLINSLLCASNNTFTCRFRVTISVELGILKGGEQRLETILKKVAKVRKNFNFKLRRYAQKSSMKAKKRINGAWADALEQYLRPWMVQSA